MLLITILIKHFLLKTEYKIGGPLIEHITR